VVRGAAKNGDDGEPGDLMKEKRGCRQGLFKRKADIEKIEMGMKKHSYYLLPASTLRGGNKPAPSGLTQKKRTHELMNRNE